MRIERVSCHLGLDTAGLFGAVFRYGVVERTVRAAARRGVTVLAWGFAPDELRLVLRGSAADIENTVRGVRVGTVRQATHFGCEVDRSATERQVVAADDLEDAIVWVHKAPLGRTQDPLGAVWSSHRDLMGFRVGHDYCSSPLRELVDRRRVHQRCGGDQLPMVSDSEQAEELRGGYRAPLTVLLRMAGAVRGVPPADRRCFRLFVHLARFVGWTNREIAGALALTARRVRQLANVREPLLAVAQVCLLDPRLRRVP